MILIDSNILIDVFDEDQDWHHWSSGQLENAVGIDDLAVGPVVVAEVGPRFATLDDFVAALRRLQIGLEPLSDEAAFIAGKAFRGHRKVHPGPKSILADFLVGGQAVVADAKILTRDASIYRRHFPSVTLMTPSKEDQ